MNPSTDFGQLLLERKNAAMVWGLLWLPAVLLGAWGALQLNAAIPDVNLAATLFVLALVVFVAPFLLPGRVLRFHERGVTEKVPFQGVFPLRYEDVEHMTWRAVKPDVGVTVHAELTGGGRRLRFEARMDTGGRFQQNLDALRDRIAAHVAARVERRIQANQPFHWGSRRGPGVRIQSDGIAYRPSGFLGAGEEQLVPWTTPLTFAIRDGFLAVSASGGREELFSMACEEPDFYPGLVVFAAMGQARRV